MEKGKGREERERGWEEEGEKDHRESRGVRRGRAQARI